MDPFQLTRALVDIESVTPNEEQVGQFLFDHLSAIAARTDGQVERIEVEPHRYNVFAHWGDPIVTLSTHMDTVPPFYASREDGDFIWGRGACDTKGIIAAMIHSVEALVTSGVRGIALLFVVGEERNSAGAYAAAKNPRGSRYLINGEPTENKLALGSTAGWLTPLIRTWANPPSRNSWMHLRRSAAFLCPAIPSSARAR
jgi:acetylornithine deacetylase